MSTLGRWLQPPPKGSLEQQYQELVNHLKAKEKALETTSHDLKVKTAAMQILEQKVMSSERQFTTAQRELTTRIEQLKTLETELAARSTRSADLETENITARQQVSELKAMVAAQTEELRTAQQAQEVQKEEIRVLREHVAQLNDGLADRGQIRARMEKLESAQDRVHQLEVELSNRESAHRTTIQQFEQTIAERDRRISTFDANAAAQADKLRAAQQAYRAAEQAQEVLKEEARVLRDQIAQLNEALPARDRLRTQVKELEPMRGRVHQLEVELSDREAAHRSTIQQLEQSIAERDQRIREFDSLAATQADEVRDSLEACRAAEQARDVQKEEIRLLREQIAQLNEGLAHQDRLRAQVKKLEAAQDRVHQLEVELSDREAAHRGTIKQLEQTIAKRDQRIGTFDANAATQADQLRASQQACHAAEQAQEFLKEEIRVLRDQIAQLNEGLADRDQLRAQVKKLELLRDRVHQLEVELSDREAAHRGTIQQLEQSMAERDRRISEFDLLAATQADEVRDALEVSRSAEQAREVHKEEIRVLREQIGQLNESLAHQDKLRAQVKKLEAARDRVHQLEVELSDREAAHRNTITQLEQSIAERDQRIGEFDASATTHANELRGAQHARQAAEQAQNVQKEEIRVLREQIAQLNEGLADRDQLRTQVKKLESARDRVHQLEVELSDREAAHRGVIQQLEQSMAERDRRISDFDSLASAQANEVQDALEACRTAEQAREVHKEEIRVLREQIAQLNEGLAHQDKLRAQVKKLETTRDRVHQLEVELSDRAAAHRSTIKQLEQSIAERDRRITKIDAHAATQTDKLHEAHQACRTAEQAQEVLKEETRVLRDQIAQLNEGLADRDQLRARLEKLESAQDRVHQLELEQSDREAAHRGMIQQLEQSMAERDRQISEFDSLAAAQANEVQDALEACRTAEQAREVHKEEIRVLREQIAQLNESLAHQDRLRNQVKKLEATQDRVHQLEVELTDREAAHRGTIKQLEQAIAKRDKRIDELVPVTHVLQEKEAAIKEWERTHARTVHDLEVETAKLQESCAAHSQLQAKQQLAEQQLQERGAQITALQRELRGLQAERQALQKDVQCIPEKDEQIAQLQKRLRETRAALRATPAAATAASQPPRQNGAERPAQEGQPKVSKESKNGKDRQEDDLKQITGISPAFADTLQKMGTHTFIQIARWKPEDIKKIAKKLETDPERIKRENWIGDAKKHHYRKYGERL